MRPFSYQRATDPDMAVQVLSAAAAANNPLTKATAQPLAGGTTLIDLMKLDVMRPAAIVDINTLAQGWSAIDPGSENLRLGALAKMSDVAAHHEIQRSYPVAANTLKLAPRAQLRNMPPLTLEFQCSKAVPVSTTPVCVSTTGRHDAWLAVEILAWVSAVAGICEIEPMKITVPWIPSSAAHRPLPFLSRSSAIRATISSAQ